MVPVGFGTAGDEPGKAFHEQAVVVVVVVASDAVIRVGSMALLGHPLWLPLHPINNNASTTTIDQFN
jgi:broad specificity phosphatase PhoE